MGISYILRNAIQTVNHFKSLIEDDRDTQHLEQIKEEYNNNLEQEKDRYDKDIRDIKIKYEKDIEDIKDTYDQQLKDIRQECNKITLSEKNKYEEWMRQRQNEHREQMGDKDDVILRLKREADQRQKEVNDKYVRLRTEFDGYKGEAEKRCNDLQKEKNDMESGYKCDLEESRRQIEELREDNGRLEQIRIQNEACMKEMEITYNSKIDQLENEKVKLHNELSLLENSYKVTIINLKY